MSQERLAAELLEIPIKDGNTASLCSHKQLVTSTL